MRSSNLFLIFCTLLQRFDQNSLDIWSSGNWLTEASWKSCSGAAFLCCFDFTFSWGECMNQHSSLFLVHSTFLSNNSMFTFHMLHKVAPILKINFTNVTSAERIVISLISNFLFRFHLVLMHIPTLISMLTFSRQVSALFVGGVCDLPVIHQI